MSKATRTCVAMVVFVSLTAASEEPRQVPPAKEAKVYQTDKFGNVQYHKPSQVVRPDGKVMQVDPFGNRLQQQYEVRGDRVYATDSVGNRSAPSFVVKGEKVYRTDQYGNVQYHKPSIEVAPDGKVTEVDPYGNRLQQKSEIQRGRPGRTNAVNGKASPEPARK